MPSGQKSANHKYAVPNFNNQLNILFLHDGIMKLYNDVLIFHVPFSAFTINNFKLADSKLEKELGWSPQESFETGLKKTIQWYLDHAPWVKRIQNGEYLDWVREHYGE